MCSTSTNNLCTQGEKVRVLDLRSAKNTLVDLVYQEILNAAHSYKYAAGARLVPDQLARSLGVSITPVKQSLERLRGKGLVEIRNGGYAIASPDETQIAEMYDAWLMCESYAIERGIGRINDEYLDALDSIFRPLQAAFDAEDGSFSAYTERAKCNGDFHMKICELWPNSKISAWFNNVQLQIWTAHVAERTEGQAFAREGCKEELIPIYESLRACDASAAVEALEQHLVISRDWLLARKRSRLSLETVDISSMQSSTLIRQA